MVRITRSNQPACCLWITKIFSQEASKVSMYLPDIDGILVSSDTVVEVTALSLPLVGGNCSRFLDAVRLNIAVVGALQSSLVLGADGSEDVVGSSDGSSLLTLILDTRVGTRVEENEGVLLGGNGAEVTRPDGCLQGSNAGSVVVLRTLDGGSANSTIGRGHGGESDKACSGDGTHDSTTVHVQRCTGTLYKKAIKRDEK
jgi:hypothetical protein